MRNVNRHFSLNFGKFCNKNNWRQCLVGFSIVILLFSAIRSLLSDLSLFELPLVRRRKSDTLDSEVSPARSEKKTVKAYQPPQNHSTGLSAPFQLNSKPNSSPYRTIQRSGFLVIFQKPVRGFHQVSKREKHLKSRGRRPNGFIVFERFLNLMKSEARVFEITSPTKKISLNYHFNKFSQFKCYIWRRQMCMFLKKSPYCCAATIFEYSSTDVTLLPSCLSVLREHVVSQRKWQSADLDLLTLAKKRKIV